MSRILIIEDNADIRRLICWTLEPDKHEIHEASNGDRGLALAQTVLPDLVVLDVMMPGQLDGYTVCARLKADPALAHVPVLLLTAMTQERDRLAGEQAGADCFLGKPFRPLELIKIINTLLKQ